MDALVPSFLKLLRDPSPHVRLNVLAKLEALSRVVNVRTLGGSLLPALKELSEDRSWRVRLATIDFTATAARLLGVDAWAAGSDAATMCLEWLHDGAFAIREAAALNLARLATAFGAPWAEKALLPRVLSLAESAGKRPPARAPVLAWQNVPIPSTHRLTALLALSVRGARPRPFIRCAAHNKRTHPPPTHTHTFPTAAPCARAFPRAAGLKGAARARGAVP